VAFGTTAPEGSVTCPRKVPVAEEGCADAGTTSPLMVATIRIAKANTDSFNTHPILSRQIEMD
jgi:hypothetical protein